jgi:Na+-driven multidrug efflux pump
MRVEGRLQRSAALSLSMSVLALLLAWILLPPLGIAGAGVAWLIAQTAGSVYVAVDVFGRMRSRPTPIVIGG